MVFIELQDKLVFVTGTKQGIGRGIAEKFVAEGSLVIGVDLAYSKEEPFKKANGFYTLYMDLGDEASILNGINEVKEKFGIPDVVVNSAGISTMDFTHESSLADWDKVFAVNARGVYLISREFSKAMLRAKKAGRIIQVDSQAGKNGYRGMGAYCASKHAVLGLTKVMALELAKSNILVNAVCPGIVETPMKVRERIEGGAIRGMTAAEVYAEDCSQIPLGRTAQPEDVANVVLFLASPLASYITGQGINVTGGMTMN